MGLIPLYCSDGNLRSHKEKGDQGWNTKYDDHSLNKMINISSNQVFQSYRKPVVIFGKDRNKVFKQLKQDNQSLQLRVVQLEAKTHNNGDYHTTTNKSSVCLSVLLLFLNNDHFFVV